MLWERGSPGAGSDLGGGRKTIKKSLVDGNPLAILLRIKRPMEENPGGQGVGRGDPKGVRRPGREPTRSAAKHHPLSRELCVQPPVAAVPEASPPGRGAPDGPRNGVCFHPEAAGGALAWRSARLQRAVAAMTGERQCGGVVVDGPAGVRHARAGQERHRAGDVWDDSGAVPSSAPPHPRAMPYLRSLLAIIVWEVFSRAASFRLDG